MDKDTFTLIGYALPYYIGEILRRGTHNLSYIYGNACINIAYPYAKVFSPYYIGKILRTPRKTPPILYRKDFAYLHTKCLEQVYSYLYSFACML